MPNRHRPNHALCDDAVGQIYSALHTPSAEHVAWQNITKSHRVYLLMASGLCAERQVDAWETFTSEEQTKITEQVKIGGELARRWSSLKWQPERKT